MLASTPVRYPAPRQLGEGDSLTLELLTNPTTGEKILDGMKESARPLAPDVMKTAAQHALEPSPAWGLHALRLRDDNRRVGLDGDPLHTTEYVDRVDARQLMEDQLDYGVGLGGLPR